MSISGIRQRKLFKNTNKSSLQKLLNDSNSSQKQQIYHLKTENSEHRDSYSSRPTLQSTNITRQLTLLENKVNKQEAVTEKCFQQMESMETHYQILASKQNQRYQIKTKLLTDRIKKQQERNKKIHHANLVIIDKIIQKMLTHTRHKQDYSPNPHQNKNPILTAFNYEGRNETTNTKQANTTKTNIQIASQFLQMIKFEKTHRQIRKMMDFQENSNANKTPWQDSQIEQTLVLEIKPMQEERESQSILLDDSFIN